MQYQISRNGQMYGPYTLEDLQRYLASGNVLPTDLAKSEEMTEWLPVSQILAGGAAVAAALPVTETPAGSGFASSGYTNVTATGSVAGGAAGSFGQPAYGAPIAQPGLTAVSPYQDAPNLHWALYLLLAIITCTLFSKVFTVIQAVWLKKVQPNSNGLIFYIGLYTLWVISLLVNGGRSVAMLMHSGDYNSYHVGHGRGLFTLVYFILLIVTRFVMSASLEEHFNGPEPVGLRLNPAMVFFFGGVYFQAKLNEINAMKQAARYGAAMRPY